MHKLSCSVFVDRVQNPIPQSVPPFPHFPVSPSVSIPIPTVATRYSGDPLPFVFPVDRNYFVHYTDSRFHPYSRPPTNL